ncbi:unnamed protein product, partial [Porites lobata]
VCQNHLENEYGADMASSLSSPFISNRLTKKKTKRDETAAPVLYAKLIYSDKTKKILSLVSTKGKKSVNPFKYLNQYCYVKMALIIEGIFIIKTVTSLQVKVHEVYIKPLKPREPLLTIKESDSDDESDTEKGEQSEDDESKDVIISDIEVDE